MKGLGLVLLLLLVASAAPAFAEFGAYDAHGYPLNVDGESTWPGHDVDAPLNVLGPVTVYPYWAILTAEVQRLADEHPDLVRLHSAGTSTLGLDLWMLEIADFARIEAGEGIPLDEREVVWVDGGTHSNEYSGVYFAAHVASFLADEYATNETARWIVENRHTWVMPMINPDGSHAMGRLNAHGVNINRNYPVVWDGEGHDPLLNNRGPSPASEVETQVNIDWFNRTQPDYYASVHCCGNLWLYPYGEEGVDPVDEEMLARVCDEAFPEVRDDCGPIWSTIYPASGSSVDTAYEYTGAVAFGYEMSGRGALLLWGQPFTTQDVRTQEYESWDGLMHAFENVHLYGAYPVVEAARGDAQGLTVTVRNQGYGPFTAGTVVVKDAAGDKHVAELPPLAPGEAATVTTQGPFAEGAGELHVHYVKRQMAAPEGIVKLDADVEEGAFVVPALETASIDADPTDASSIPGPGALVALAVLGLAALASLRRRW